VAFQQQARERRQVARLALPKPDGADEGAMPASPSAAIAAGSGAAAKRAGVQRFTAASVVWAESTTATSSSNGSWWASSLSGSGLASARASMKPTACSPVMRGDGRAARGPVPCAAAADARATGPARLRALRVARRRRAGRRISPRGGARGHGGIRVPTPDTPVMSASPPQPEPVLFEAVCTANQSLGDRGMAAVAAFVVAASAAVAVLFSALGAWPVVGFTGLEVLLVLGLLARHRAAGGGRWRCWPSPATGW
jgi:hypothetical protein